MTSLKLLAFDAEDLGVVSAHLQDAVLTVNDMAYQPNERRFVLIANRLDQVAAIDGDKVRRRTALRIERVTRAEVQGVDLKARSATLALLAINYTALEAPAATLTLVFSGQSAIRLHVECVEASLADLGPAWATATLPDHGLDAPHAPPDEPLKTEPLKTEPSRTEPHLTQKG